METFELTLETLEELRTKEWYKKREQQRAQEIESCANKVKEMLASGEASNRDINNVLSESFDACSYSEDECKKVKFGEFKQRVMAKAHSHNKAKGKHRAYYRYKDKQVNIYTCRDLEALRYLANFMLSNRETWDEGYQDIIAQIYRVEHDLDNFAQVDLFDVAM